jgi:FeS assembly protein IscX
MNEPLNWDATFAIALALKRKYKEANLEDVSLQQIYEWTIALEDFEDDLALANDGILSNIYQEWFEEILHDTQ